MLERGWPGRIDGDVVVQLAAQTLEAFFTGGGAAREHAVYPLADVMLRAPVLAAAVDPGLRRRRQLRIRESNRTPLTSRRARVRGGDASTTASAGPRAATAPTAASAGWTRLGDWRVHGLPLRWTVTSRLLARARSVRRPTITARRIRAGSAASSSRFGRGTRAHRRNLSTGTGSTCTGDESCGFTDALPEDVLRARTRSSSATRTRVELRVQLQLPLAPKPELLFRHSAGQGQGALRARSPHERVSSCGLARRESLSARRCRRSGSADPGGPYELWRQRARRRSVSSPRPRQRASSSGVAGADRRRRARHAAARAAGRSRDPSPRAARRARSRRRTRLATSARSAVPEVALRRGPFDERAPFSVATSASARPSALIARPAGRLGVV